MAVCIQGDLSFWNKRRSFHGFSPLGFEGQPSIAKRPRLAPSEESAQPPSPSTLDAASSTPVATAAAAAAATASIANTAFSATVAAATEKKLPEGVQVGIVHRVKPDGGGQVVAYGGKGDKLPFKASSVLNAGPDAYGSSDSRLRRGDCVEYRVEADENGKWVAVHVAFVSRDERSSQLPAVASSSSSSNPSSADALQSQTSPMFPYPPTTGVPPHSNYLPPGMGYSYPPSLPVPPPHEQAGIHSGNHANAVDAPAWMMAPPAYVAAVAPSTSSSSGATMGYESAVAATAAEARSTSQATFIPSAAWAGAVPGYVFRSGVQGQGYYLEGGGRAGAAGSAAGSTSIAPSVEAPTPAPAPDAAAGVDCGAALEKVSKALSGSKASKAAALCQRLVEAQLNPHTAQLFLDALSNAWVDSKSGGARIWNAPAKAPKDARDPLIALCSAVRQRLSCFADADAAAAVANASSTSEDAGHAGDDIRSSITGVQLGVMEARARAMVLGVGTRLALTSDDTYTYAAAMKVVRENWDLLPSLASLEFGLESEDEKEGATAKKKEVYASLRNALVDCLETAWEKKSWSWAKAEIELTFGFAAERRLRLPEGEERERLDVLTSKMRAGQRNTFVRTAVRAVNSAAHPLRNVGNNDAVR